MKELLPLLNRIAEDWCLSEPYRARFQFLGVDPAQWPDCQPKALMLRFRKNPSDAVKFEIISALESQSKAELPKSEIEFRAVYQRLLKIERSRELARKLTKNPEDGEAIVDEFRKSVVSSNELITVAELFRDGLKDIEKRIEEKRALIEIPTWPLLSQGIGGFNGGRVTLFTAKTGFGKTTIALSWAMLMSRIQPTVFLNMEMPTSDLAPKAYSVAAGDLMSNWYRGLIDYEKIGTVVTGIKHPLLFTKGKTLSIDQIISLVMVASADHGPSFFILDYDQKISTRYGVDEWKALQIAVHELEQVAISTDSHILLLSQANDDGDPRASKRMLQPAATHLVFDEDDSGVFISAAKNRFGKKNFRVSVKYEPSVGRILETGIASDRRPKGF